MLLASIIIGFSLVISQIDCSFIAVPHFSFKIVFCDSDNCFCMLHVETYSNPQYSLNWPDKKLLLFAPSNASWNIIVCVFDFSSFKKKDIPFARVWKLLKSFTSIFFDG